MSLNSPLQIINTVVTPQAVQNADQVGNTTNIYKVTGNFVSFSSDSASTNYIVYPPGGSSVGGTVQVLSLPVNCVPIGCVLLNIGGTDATSSNAGTLSIVISPDGDNSDSDNVIFPGVTNAPLVAGAILSANCGISTAFNAGTTLTNIGKNVYWRLSANGAVIGSFQVVIYYTM